MSRPSLPTDPTEPPPDSNIVSADSLAYWNSVSADVNGVLGGFPQVSRIDLQGSKNFIAKVRRRLNAGSSKPIARMIPLAVNCGAGIGRVTTGLLTSICEMVDAVEPTEKFASVLISHPLRQEGRIGDVYICGLESWIPSKKYDLVWTQWCAGYVKDSQLTEYLQRVSQSLTEEGWICVKENLSTDSFGKDVFDEVDSSVTRSDAKFHQIFEAAGLEVIKAELQSGFPKSLGLLPVKMYALRPKAYTQ